MEEPRDLIIIGSGPGGYVAAIRAAQLGLKATVVEKDKPGGVCLNIGCIPSKALIHQAELFESAAALRAMGVAVDVSGLDYAKVFAATRAAADTLSRGVRFLFKKNNIELIEGTATLAGPGRVSVKIAEGQRTLTAGKVLLATGSRPRSIAGFDIDEQRVLSSTGLLMLQQLPQSMLVLGSGYIGMELAYAMSVFGVKVHVVEVLDQVLPAEDADIVRVVERAFGARGVRFSVSTTAVGMNRVDNGMQVMLRDAKGGEAVETAETVLVAVGRAPNTEGIGLETVGVRTDSKGFVQVGDGYRTAAEGVYAIGDIVPSPLLAHVASKEGQIAVEHMAGRAPGARVDERAIPLAIYCQPQVAGFGLNEKAATSQNVAYRVATFPYRGAGKAVSIGRPEGLVKLLVAPETHEILGAGIVGFDATEVIHELLLAKSAELLPGDVAGMIHAHPTISEIVMEVCRAAEGWAIHV